MKRKKTVFLFPGQGAQYPGMGKTFFENYAAAREVLQRADDFLGMSLSRIILEGPREKLAQTEYSQPAIFVTSLAMLAAVKQEFPFLAPDICAGLSLGEYTALVAAEKLSFEDGLALVSERGKAMQRASRENPGTLAVVLGLPLETVERTAKEIPQLWIANLNCPGQIVIAGTLNAIEKAKAVLKDLGAKRVLSLDVSGAFHSGLMKGAQKALEPLIEKTPFQESSIEIVMNVPGSFVISTKVIKQYLVEQVASTTQWERGIRCIEAEAPPHLYIEIGPGKTLKGMNDKIGINGQTLSVENVKDLEALASSIEAVSLT